MRAIRSRATQMPALPSGAFLKLQELNAAAVASSGSAATEQHSGSLGGRVWKSAAALCRWQRAHASLFEGTRVIELGSGALPDVLARSQRFLKSVTQVTSRYGRQPDALEAADLRHEDGYAIRLRGVTTLAMDAQK